MKTKFFLIFMLFLISLPLIAKETYTYRTIKAESSKDNPNVMNITSSYESKDENGNVKNDTSSSTVDLSDNKSYSIKMNDDSAEFEILPASVDFDDDTSYINYDIHSAFDEMHRRHIDMMNNMFENDPFFSHRNRTVQSTREPQMAVERENNPPQMKKAKTSFFKNLYNWLNYLGTSR